MINFKNKKILVTGASGGIGSAIARAFLAEKSKVCLVSRGSRKLFELEKKLINKFGSNILLYFHSVELRISNDKSPLILFQIPGLIFNLCFCKCNFSIIT